MAPSPGGALPADFEWLVEDGWRIAVRHGFSKTLVRSGIGDPAMLASTGSPRFRGRGDTAALVLPDGTRAVLRRYLHGGLLRGIRRSRFWGAPRPIRELLATEQARRSGVRVPEILAALFRPVAWMCHEGWLLTREIEGAEELTGAIEGGRAAGPLLLEVGREARLLSEAGVWHADLHARNVLVSGEGVVLIDFDRARIMAPVPERLRERSLLRFDRSLVKLGLTEERVSSSDRFRLFAGYNGGRLDRQKRNELAARCRRGLRWHRLWWSVFR